MALIVLAADKGSPGVTTAAVALAAVWPRRALLAETDPAGGDLVYRSAAAHGGMLNPNTGMLSIAATARRGLVPDQLWDHVQPLSGGLEVLVGLGIAEQAAGLAGLWPTLGSAFAQLADSPNAPADVIADCGRISGDTPVVDLFPHAALVLLISRTEPEAIARVRDRAAALSTKLHGGPRGAASLATPSSGSSSSPTRTTRASWSTRSTTCSYTRRRVPGLSALWPKTRPAPSSWRGVSAGGSTSRCSSGRPAR